jgi:hypothetical protein
MLCASFSAGVCIIYFKNDARIMNASLGFKYGIRKILHWGLTALHAGQRASLMPARAECGHDPENQKSDE